ncbi:MAG: hypothetical protein OWU84_00620 [Firmicutes bacterium]|nr:hypothetical protein [Bacillota bacterium]
MSHSTVFLPNHEIPNPAFQTRNSMEDFLTPKLGWKLIFGGAVSGSQAATLFITTDGSHQWHRLDQISAALPGDKDGVSFLSQNRGWLAGSFFPGSWRVEPYLYQTQDGGRTWTRVILPFPVDKTNAELNLAPPAFFSSTAGVLVGYYSSVPKTAPVGALWVTTDGGHTWHWEPLRGRRMGPLAWRLPHPATLIVTDHGHSWITRDDGYVWHLS